MIVCENCPYKGRCEIKQRCIQGKNNGPDLTPEPKPSKLVLTSRGMSETAGKVNAPIKGSSKGAKKSSRKVTMN